LPTAILLRQVARPRGRCLIVNLRGKPSAVAACLGAIFAAVPNCLDLAGTGRIEADPSVVVAFRARMSAPH